MIERGEERDDQSRRALKRRQEMGSQKRRNLGTDHFCAAKKSIGPVSSQKKFFQRREVSNAVERNLSIGSPKKKKKWQSIGNEGQTKLMQWW